MPLEGTLQRHRLTPAPGPLEREGPGLWDTTIAAFQLENSVAGGFAPSIPAEPDYRALDHMSDDEIQVSPSLAGAQSQAELARMRTDLDRERTNRRILSEAGWTGFGLQLGASIVDPIALAFGGPAGRGAFLAARGGGRAVAGAAAGATGAAVDTAVQESLLQAQQQERTTLESVAAVIAAGALGGALGGVLGAAGGKAAREGLAAGVADVSRQAEAEAAGGSVGAAAFRPIDPEDLKVAPALGVERVLGSKASSHLAAPGIRVAGSPFDATREAAWRMVDLGVRTVGDMAGRARPQAAQTHARAFTDFELSRQQKAAKLLYEQRQDRAMSERDFWVEVTRANSAGDVHSDPSIQSAAHWWRANVYEPRKVEAQALGLLPDELAVRGAKGYAPRDFDFRRLSREAGRFQDTVRGWLVQSGVDAGEAEELAEFLYSSLMSAPNGRLPQVKLPPGKPAPLRERVLNIPDEVLDRWLERDARRLGERYTRSLVADIKMTEAFGGVAPEKWLGEQRAKLRDETAKKGAEAEARGDEKAARALAKRADEDDKTLQTLFDRVRGTDVHDRNPNTLGSLASPVLRTIANVTPTQMLGTVAISSLTDAANIVFQHGLARTMGTALRQLAVGFGGMRGVSKAEMQKAGAMLEAATQSRRRAMWDAGTNDRQAETIERGTQRMSDQFFRLTLLNQWTDGMSGFAALMSTQRILDAAQALAKGGKLSKADARHLAAAGLDENMLKRIGAEQASWQSIPGGRVGNADAWADREAARAFRGAVAHGSDMAVMRPNAASVPFWVGSAGSRLIYQFKSFASTMVARTLMSGLQRRDMAVLNGWMLMTAMGGLVTAAKDVANRGEVQERTTGEWVTEAIDRGGLVQYVFEANDLLLEPFGISPLPTTSRFAERQNIIGKLAGPAGSQVDRTVRLINGSLKALSGQGFTQGDARNATRLLPFGNLAGVRVLFDEAIEGMDLPEQRQ